MNQDTTKKKEAVVAIFNSHTQAEAAVKKLQHVGFEINNLSIIARDFHTDEHVVGYYNAGDRMKYWGKQGAIWGGFWGLFFGSAFFLVPGLGPILVAGPLVGWILAGLEQAVVVGGLSAVGAGIYSIGIPKDSVLNYESEIKAGKFVLIIHETPEQVIQAQEVLKDFGPEQLHSFNSALNSTELKKEILNAKELNVLATQESLSQPL